MSKSQNQNYQFWKDVLISLKRTPSYRGAVKLSARDNDTLSQVLMLNAMNVKDSVPEAGSRSNANLKRWCLFAKNLDVAYLDELQKSILLYLRNVEESMTYDRFKHDLGVDVRDVGAFMAPLTDVLKQFLQKPNASAFRHLNQFLSFAKTTTLLDFDFREEALADYYKTEDRLAELVLNPDYVSEIRSVITEWFGSFRLEGISPKHGPGGIAEFGRGTPAEKNAVVGIDLRAKNLLRETTDLEDIFFDPDFKFNRTAKVVFVPKSLSSMRTICMEPASLMFLQQGCWSQIDDYMVKHHTLSNVIRLKDQMHNRRMSKIGSANGRYATIDLSAASDSVSWDLVQKVFAGTDYYRACLLTRSTHISLPDGNIIVPHKFAPMGSTICFPTECILFAAMCEVVARRHGIRRRDFYSVYGDDIIIDVAYASELNNLLEETGFLVNKTKSYYDGPFRESCGGEYFQGNEVTPTKIPRNFKGSLVTSHEPSLFKTLVSFTNTLFDLNYKTSRTFLIKKFDVLPRHLQPIFDDGTKGIKSDQPTNFHLKIKYCEHLQLYKIQHGDISSAREMESDTPAALFTWFVQATQRPKSNVAFKEPCDLVSVRRTSPKLQLKQTNTLAELREFAYPRLAEISDELSIGAVLVL